MLTNNSAEYFFERGRYIRNDKDILIALDYVTVNWADFERFNKWIAEPLTLEVIDKYGFAIGSIISTKQTIFKHKPAAS